MKISLHKYPTPVISFLLATLIFLCPVQPLQAQENTLPEDTTSLEIREGDYSQMENILESGDFDYSVPREPETLWDRIRQWFFQQIFQLADNKWVKLFFKISFFAIFAVILIGLINQLLGGQIVNTFSGTASSDSLNFKISNDQLSDIDLEEELSAALEENRYSDALRILYLKTLRELSQKGLIREKADKTNHEYLAELQSHEIFPSFSRLTSIYEYVEYGGFSVGKQGFQKARDLYENITRQTGEQS